MSTENTNQPRPDDQAPPEGLQVGKDDAQPQVVEPVVAPTAIEEASATPESILPLAQRLESKESEKPVNDKPVTGKEDKGSKVEDKRTPLRFPIARQQRLAVQKLFVAPPQYFEELRPLFEHCRIGVVDGSDYVDRLITVQYLGLLVADQVVAPSQARFGADPFKKLEKQVEDLLKRIDTSPHYGIATNWAQSLDENLANVRAYGDTETLQHKRNEIRSRLNRIAIDALGLSLGEMRSQPSKETRAIGDVDMLEWSDTDGPLLLEWVNQELDENRVYIFHKPIASIAELNIRLEALAASLKERNIYLLFITSSLERTFLSEHLCYVAASPPSEEHGEDEFVRNVLRHYIAYYQSVIPKATNDALEELVKTFHANRFSIANLIEELKTLDDEAPKERIRSAAEGIGKLDLRYARNQFQTWEANHKFYAMCIVLFTDVRRTTLDKIYTAAVSALRTSGVTTLRDPREIGMDDLLQTIRAHETTDGRIAFQHGVLATEVEHQIENHRHLLWSLHKVILEWVAQNKKPDQWHLRRSLGLALGLMGVYQMEELRQTLDTLAGDPSGSVVAVAGYALDRVCRVAPDKQREVSQILRGWGESLDLDFMWAASAAIWRIYDGLVEMAQSDDLHNAQCAAATLEEMSSIFTLLVKNFNNIRLQIPHEVSGGALHALTSNELFLHNLIAASAIANINIAQAILHAIRNIAQKHTSRIVTQLLTWLQPTASDNELQIGVLASRQLFQEHAQPDSSLTEQQQLAMLRLMQPLILAAKRLNAKLTDASAHERHHEVVNVQEIVDSIVLALLQWLKRADGSTQIQTHLLYLLNRSTAEVADLFCHSIAYHWLENDQAFGQALMSRTYAMHGIAMDLPGCNSGLLLLDAAEDACANQVGVRTGAALYQRFAPLLDLYLLKMGEQAIAIAPGQSVRAADLELSHSLPALVLPALHAAPSPHPALIIVLTWDRVIDAEDLLLHGAATETIAVILGEQASQDQTQWPAQTQVIAIQNDGIGWGAAVQAVKQGVVKLLIKQSAAEWWSALQPHVASDAENDPAQVIQHLQDQLDHLDDLDYCRYPNDLMRIVLYTSGWLAQSNLPLCVETLQRWLTSDNANQKLAAVACVKFLFTLFSLCEPLPSVASHAPLLQLAPQLGAEDWEAVHTILEAAHRWCVQPEWRRRLLVQPSGDTSELFAMITKTAPTNEVAMRRLFDAWATAQPATKKESHDVAREEFVQQLRLRLALSTRQPLPTLADGAAYGLVLFDTAIHNPKDRRRLAELAAKVIGFMTDELKQKKQTTLQLLSFWLGSEHLVAGPGEKPENNDLLPASRKMPARLLGATLDRFTAKQVAFVLIFTDRLPHDSEDWRNSEWQKRIVFYCQTPTANWSTGFKQLSSLEEIEKAVPAISQELLKFVGV